MQKSISMLHTCLYLYYYLYNYYYSTGISRCDFSQKRAENKGVQVRTRRDKCVSATKKVRTNDNNKNNKQEGDKPHFLHKWQQRCHTTQKNII